MTRNEVRIPKRRFKEFESAEAWEQRRLGEISDIIGGGTPSTTIKKYWNGVINWYTPAEIGNQIFLRSSQKKITELGLQNSSARMLPIGSILFTSRAGIGNSAILIESGATNQGFQSIVPCENFLDTYFIFSRTNELKKYGELVGAGSTFTEVSGKQMMNMLILIPKLREQKKIGSFFKTLDDTITMHQRKLEKLKALKTAYLAKMFPADGESKPKLRFKGFADDWEQRKLEDIFFFLKGKGLSLDTFEEGSHAPSIAYGHIYTKYTEVIYNVSFSSSEEGVLSINGDILFPGSSTVINGTAQATAIMIDNVKLGGDIIIARRKSNKYYSPFISYLINSNKRLLYPIIVGSTITHMYGKDLAKLSYYFPKKIEQQKIGDFFKTLDDTIAIHQRKLEKLQNIKQAYLNEMFV